MSSIAGLVIDSTGNAAKYNGILVLANRKCVQRISAVLSVNKRQEMGFHDTEFRI